MRRIVWVILACLLLGGAWYYFHSGSDEGASGSGSGKAGGSRKGGKNSMVPVGTATVRTGDITVYLNGLGNITPRSTVTVHSLVNGELEAILFKEGQMVRQGELLAKIDDRPYVAVLEQAQGLLTRDQALLAEARINLERYQTLFKQDSIARQQVDAQASLVTQYEGAVRNDEGQMDAAKVNVAYTRITAPVSGRVGLRQVDLGNIVHTTDTNGIVVVTELQPITAIFTLPEDSLPDVFKHTNANETLDVEAWDRANKTKLSTGTLTAVDNQVDPTTGTVKFRAEFANDDLSLFPSQFVNLRLKLETLKDAVVIPVAAVQRGTQGTFVYKLADKKTVSVVPVTLGPGEGERVSVQNGMAAGDEVVVDGADTLRDGAKVEVAAVDGKPTAAPEKGGKGKGDAKAGDKGDKASDAAKTDATKSPDAGNADAPKTDAKSDEAKPRHHRKKHADDAGQ